MRDLRAILGVTSALAAPFDLMTMLGEVVNAAKQVLQADRGSVWLHDPATDELVLEVATGIEPIRVPSGAGLVGACARNRQIINVPDCYADPRFDPGVDKSIRLPHALHADAAADRSQGRARRRDAGAEQEGRRLRRGRRGPRDGAGRAVRGRAAARAHDRRADRRREDAAGARDGARGPDEHAAVDDAGDSRLRRLRIVPARRAHRRRHLRSVAARRGAAGRPGRRHRPRDRAGAVGDADAGDAAHGVPPRRRPRVARSCRSTTGSPRRSPPTASSRPSSGCSIRRRTGCAFTAAARRRSCITRRRSGRACATSRRAFRWGRCRSPS